MGDAPSLRPEKVGRLPTLRGDGSFITGCEAGGMPSYRRFRVRGGTCVFTVNLAARGSALPTERIGALRAARGATMAEHPAHCDAVVVMPDHVLAIRALPPGDAGFSIRRRKIKARLSRAGGAVAGPRDSLVRRREAGVRQRRFWEHMIRDEVDFAAHLALCWGSPVRGGLAERAAEWAFSPIRRDIRAGRVAADRAGETAAA